MQTSDRAWRSCLHSAWWREWEGLRVWSYDPVIQLARGSFSLDPIHMVPIDILSLESMSAKLSNSIATVYAARTAHDFELVLRLVTQRDDTGETSANGQWVSTGNVRNLWSSLEKMLEKEGFWWEWECKWWDDVLILNFG